MVDLLDAGGEVALRARLGQCTLAELKQIVSANKYDEEKETTRWRSTNKCIDLIVDCTQQQLEPGTGEAAGKCGFVDAVRTAFVPLCRRVTGDSSRSPSGSVSHTAGEGALRERFGVIR